MDLISLSLFFVCSRSGKAMLSYRLIEPKRAPSWNSTPNSFRTLYSSRSDSLVMSRSSMTIAPRSGLSRPTSVLRKTDLPVPDGPSSTEIWPAGKVKLTSAQMFCLPKDFVSPSILTSTPTHQLLTRICSANPGGSPIPDQRAGREAVTAGR